MATLYELDRSAADAPLRRETLHIQSLAPARRDQYRTLWHEAQGQFTDDPSRAVERADALIQTVMRESGDGDLSHVVETFRAAHRIVVALRHGDAGAEELRKAFAYYRELFDALVDARVRVATPR